MRVINGTMIPKIAAATVVRIRTRATIARMVPANPACARAGFKHLARCVERLGQTLVFLRPAKNASHPDGKNGSPCHRLREQQPPFDVSRHRLAGLIDSGVIHPRSGQPQRLAKGKRRLERRALANDRTPRVPNSARHPQR